MTDSLDEEYKRGIATQIPLQRFGKADEVAELIHLASLGGNETEVRQRAKTLKEQYCKIHYCWEYEGKAYPKPKWSNL